MKAIPHIGFNLTVDFIKQGKSVVAYSPALDISTVGKNQKEAQERFTELVSLFFEELTANNTLADVLSELGWQKQKKNWNPPKIVTSKPIRFDLPISA